jgi:broad specificity phosphatase PhoE
MKIAIFSTQDFERESFDAATAEKAYTWSKGKLGEVDDNVLLFSSGHFVRVLAARWLGREPDAGRLVLLSTDNLSALGYQHSRAEQVIRLWDDAQHIGN